MIPRLLVDTNAYTALFAGHEGIADLISDSEAILLSAVVVGELLDGFLGGTREEENRRDLDQLRAKSRTVVVPITADTAEWVCNGQAAVAKEGHADPHQRCLDRGIRPRARSNSGQPGPPLRERRRPAPSVGTCLVPPADRFLFDRAPDRPWADKIFRRAPSEAGEPITV